MAAAKKPPALEESMHSDGGDLPPPPPPPKASKPKPVFKVWAHGPLQRSGVTYNPGDIVDVSEEEAATIPCLERVELSPEK